MRITRTLLIYSGLTILCGCDVPTGPSAAPIPWPQQDHSSMAYIQVQDFVEKMLKAPGSAKWPGMFESVDHARADGNQTYTIRSWVDSQNSFGALLRNSYTARVQEVSPDNWKLLFFKFDNSDEVFGSLEPQTEVVKAAPSKPAAPSPYEYEPVVLNQEAEEMAKAEEAARIEAIEAAKFRTWTSKNGTFTLEAKLLSLGMGIATLETREGVKKKVPIEKLGEADQDFITKWKREKR